MLVDFQNEGYIGSDSLGWPRLALIIWQHPETHEAFLHYLSNREDQQDKASGKGMTWCRKIFEFLKLFIKLLMCAKLINSSLLPPRFAEQFQALDALQLQRTATFSQLSR